MFQRYSSASPGYPPVGHAHSIPASYATGCYVMQQQCNGCCGVGCQGDGHVHVPQQPTPATMMDYDAGFLPNSDNRQPHQQPQQAYCNNAAVSNMETEFRPIDDSFHGDPTSPVQYQYTQQPYPQQHYQYGDIPMQPAVIHHQLQQQQQYHEHLHRAHQFQQQNDLHYASVLPQQQPYGGDAVACHVTYSPVPHQRHLPVAPVQFTAPIHYTGGRSPQSVTTNGRHPVGMQYVLVAAPEMTSSYHPTVTSDGHSSSPCCQCGGPTPPAMTSQDVDRIPRDQQDGGSRPTSRTRDVINGAGSNAAQPEISPVVQTTPRTARRSVPPAAQRGTPLYGQPAWWGDNDDDDQVTSKTNGHVIDVESRMTLSSSASRPNQLMLEPGLDMHSTMHSLTPPERDSNYNITSHVHDSSHQTQNQTTSFGREFQPISSIDRVQVTSSSVKCHPTSTVINVVPASSQMCFEQVVHRGPGFLSEKTAGSGDCRGETERLKSSELGTNSLSTLSSIPNATSTTAAVAAAAANNNNYVREISFDNEVVTAQVISRVTSTNSQQKDTASQSPLSSTSPAPPTTQKAMTMMTSSSPVQNGIDDVIPCRPQGGAAFTVRLDDDLEELDLSLNISNCVPARLQRTKQQNWKDGADNKMASSKRLTSATLSADNRRSFAVPNDRKKRTTTQNSADRLATKSANIVDRRRNDVKNANKNLSAAAGRQISGMSCDVGEVISTANDDGDISDDISDTGTYTIEAGDDDDGVKEARRNIDREFGITVETDNCRVSPNITTKKRLLPPVPDAQSSTVEQTLQSDVANKSLSTANYCVDDSLISTSPTMAVDTSTFQIMRPSVEPLNCETSENIVESADITRSQHATTEDVLQTENSCILEPVVVPPRKTLIVREREGQMIEEKTDADDKLSGVSINHEERHSSRSALVREELASSVWKTAALVDGLSRREKTAKTTSDDTPLLLRSTAYEGLDSNKQMAIGLSSPMMSRKVMPSNVQNIARGEGQKQTPAIASEHSRFSAAVVNSSVKTASVPVKVSPSDRSRSKSTSRTSRLETTAPSLFQPISSSSFPSAARRGSSPVVSSRKTDTKAASSESNSTRSGPSRTANGARSHSSSRTSMTTTSLSRESSNISSKSVAAAGRSHSASRRSSSPISSTASFTPIGKPSSADSSGRQRPAMRASLTPRSPDKQLNMGIQTRGGTVRTSGGVTSSPVVARSSRTRRYNEPEIATSSPLSPVESSIIAEVSRTLTSKMRAMTSPANIKGSHDSIEAGNCGSDTGSMGSQEPAGKNGQVACNELMIDSILTLTRRIHKSATQIFNKRRSTRLSVDEDVTKCADDSNDAKLNLTLSLLTDTEQLLVKLSK